MEIPPQLEAISGARELRDWFGYWPTFHDAEILSLHLNRAGLSTMAVHTNSLIVEKAENGYRRILEDCFGIAGTIDAREISIRLTSGKPEHA